MRSRRSRRSRKLSHTQTSIPCGMLNNSMMYEESFKMFIHKTGPEDCIMNRFIFLQHDYLKEYGDQVTAELEEKKKSRQKKKSSKKTAESTSVTVDESSNLSET